MVAFLVLSRAPPLVALLGFLRVREKEQKMFCKTALGLEVPLYSETSNDLILILIYLFI